MYCGQKHCEINFKWFSRTYWTETWEIGIFLQIKGHIPERKEEKSDIKSGIPFMVTNLEYKFLICAWWKL